MRRCRSIKKKVEKLRDKLNCDCEDRDNRGVDSNQVSWLKHYENMPMQYIEIFSSVKIENFIGKCLIFSIFLLKTLIVGTR